MRTTGVRVRATVASCLLVAGVVSTPVGTGVAASDGSRATVPVVFAAASTIATEVEADLHEPGRLTICSSFPRVRFAEMDAAGEPFGADIEIGVELATRLGLEPEVREIPFESLIDAVVGGECDVSVSGQFITQGRLEVIDMIAYREGTPHVIVRAGNPLGIAELVDLCGRSMAVVSGTVHVEIVLGVGDYAGRGIDDQCRAAGRPTVELLEYPDQAEAEGALARGDADAYSGNDFVVVDRPQDFALSAELLPTRNGIGLRQDAPSLSAAIRASLGAMIADGSYLAILEKYDVAHAAVSSPP